MDKERDTHNNNSKLKYEKIVCLLRKKKDHKDVEESLKATEIGIDSREN